MVSISFISAENNVYFIPCFSGCLVSPKLESKTANYHDVNPPIESKFPCDILASIGWCKWHDSLQFCIPSLDKASNLINQGEQQAVLHRCQIHVRFHELYYFTVKHNKFTADCTSRDADNMSCIIIAMNSWSKGMAIPITPA